MTLTQQASILDTETRLAPTRATADYYSAWEASPRAAGATMTAALAQRLAALEREVAALRQALKERPVVSTTTIRDLGNDAYSLKEPIGVVVETYEEEVVARWPELEAWASASTESEALAGLKQRICDDYQDLHKADAATLGRLPRAWQRILNTLIELNGEP